MHFSPSLGLEELIQSGFRISTSDRDAGPEFPGGPTRHQSIGREGDRSFSLTGTQTWSSSRSSPSTWTG